MRCTQCGVGELRIFRRARVRDKRAVWCGNMACFAWFIGEGMARGDRRSPPSVLRFDGVLTDQFRPLKRVDGFIRELMVISVSLDDWLHHRALLSSS